MASRSKKYYDKNPKAKAKKKAYDTKYQSSPEQKKRRASRNAARRLMKKKGVSLKGKDVDHKNGNPKDNHPSNLRAMSKKKNRGRKK